MLKSIATAAALLAASAAAAQAPAASPGAACPSGTRYTTIRHSKVKPGQWAAFEKAVAAHNAWYADRDNDTRTGLVRVLTPPPGTAALSAVEAVTITRYADAPAPAHDAAWTAFTSQYKASSEVVDEARVCLPTAP